jgi:guanylate kinase
MKKKKSATSVGNKWFEYEVKGMLVTRIKAKRQVKEESNVGKVFVMYGPSTAGKTEIQKSITSPVFPRVITSTSRQVRKGELNGKHYHFFTEGEFYEKIQPGEFLE